MSCHWILLYVSIPEQITSCLSVETCDPASLGGEFDQLVDEAVRHSMTVAHLSEEGQRNKVIQKCHQVKGN